MGAARLKIAILYGWELAALVLLAGAPVFAQAPRAPQPKFIVVLDAAHGGDDAGAALKSGQAEKSLTLAFAVKLRSLLTARGMTVLTTRDSDQAITPNQRAEIANRAQAQACLSLHFSDTGSGVHLFVSDLPAAPSGHFLPWKTAQSAWVNRSLALTGEFNSALQHASLPITLGRTALAGIDSMACPAVAIEIAPERTPGSVAVKSALNDPNYQSRVAEALAAALLVWRTEARP
jgi:N-acetylmuramoyl-L-alanine amidase